MKVLDAHTHIHDSAYDADREEVLRRMEDLDLGAITVGTSLGESKAALDLAEKYEFVFATVGQHPTDTEEEFDIISFRELIKSPKVVGVGECGLDYFRNPSLEEKERQKELFLKHAELAKEFDKPLMIHCRPTLGTEDSHGEMISMLKNIKKEWPGLRGSIHFFTGNLNLAENYRELGFVVSLPGVVTFAKELEGLVRGLPKDSFLVETDAPYAAPVPNRGKRNEPPFILDTIRYIASLRGEDSEEVSSYSLNTAKKLFKIA